MSSAVFVGRCVIVLWEELLWLVKVVAASRTLLRRNYNLPPTELLTRVPIQTKVTPRYVGRLSCLVTVVAVDNNGGQSYSD